jgi:diguanylate cyclase (GGDEF)-like protein
MLSNILKTSVSSAKQVIFSVLGVFLVSFIAVAAWATWTLRSNFERLLVEQQQSVVKLLASEVETELNDRVGALKIVAAELDALALEPTTQLALAIEKKGVLRSLFNAGLFVVGADGLAVVEVPRTGRLGKSYLDRDYFSAVMKTGQAFVGQPVLDKSLEKPTFAIAVPLRNAQGAVIGLLVGATELLKPNFLDPITNNNYGKTGQFLVVAVGSRLIVKTSDPKRVMEQLPEQGQIPALDALLSGRESTGTFFDSSHQEVVASGVIISGAAWYVGSYIPVRDAFAPITDIQRQILLATGVIAALAALLAWWLVGNQLKQLLAFYDPLTQLPNRRIFDDRLGQSLLAVKRHGTSGALMVLDLDNFKLLNDKQGHLFGDLLLVEVAARLNACVREVDTVARFGGDEFVVILSGLDADKAVATAQARVVAEKISASLCAPYVLKGEPVGRAHRHVAHQGSASVGVVVFSSHLERQATLFNRADAAMYQAKKSGRNAVMFSDDAP